MSLVSPEQLAAEIHARPLRLVIALTGGGSGAISGLLGVPGASKSVLAAHVPYADSALESWLGCRPEQFCSERTARVMAMTAYLEARRYAPSATVCGVACTASLASDRPKRGAHRAHVAYQTADATASASLELDKGRRTRREEEELVTALLLNHIAQACGAQGRLAVALCENEQVQARHVMAGRDQQELLAGRARAIRGTWAARPAPAAVFPGAFHPLHEGHRAMRQLAAEILGALVDYEMSIENVEKPPLDFLEIESRLAQFSPNDAVWLTRAPHFHQKAALFPGATFVVGADTILRVADPRYYAGDAAARDRAISDIAKSGCRFLIFARVVEGSFRALTQLGLPPALAALCQQVPPEQFRQDVSSTALRGQQASE